MTHDIHEAANMHTQAVTLVAAEPVGSSWAELWPQLHECWRLSTDLANWCVQRLFTLDTMGEPKMPEAVAKWYGYGDAGKHYPRWGDWSGAMASAQCVIRGVQRLYRQRRFAIMVRHEQSLLSFRYPYPFPTHNKDWKPLLSECGEPLVSLPLPGVGRITLRLKRRADFGRQLAAFRQLLNGDAERGEAALYMDRKKNLLVKLVGRFPARAVEPGTRVCFLHTDPNAFLVAEIDGRSPVLWNCDNLRRIIAEHRTYLQRSSEDMKREKRMSPRQRKQFNDSRAQRCEKQNARLKTATHELSAQVACFCERQRVGLVAYDDSIREFFGDARFPWHDFETKLAYKLAQRSVDFVSDRYVHLTQEERQEWLRLSKATAQAGTKAVAHKRRKGSHPAVTS